MLPSCDTGLSATVTPGKGVSAHAWGAGGVADGGAGGRVAPLNLIEEHLTDVPYPRGFHAAIHRGRQVPGWYFPDDFQTSPDLHSYVLKVQSFLHGGYESTVRLINMEKVGAAMDGYGPCGKRSKPEELNPDHIAKAAARAKRKSRHLIRNMGATHMTTFTVRETEQTGFRTRGQWLELWDRYRRLLTKALGGEFPYVAVLERHEKGNFHLHVAWVGRVNLNIVRPIWWTVCGGRGMGNVHARYFKVPPGGDRAARIARYISKYVTKSFAEEPDFNKKRYWASRQTLPELRRYVLRAQSFAEALEEVRLMLGLDWSRFQVLGARGVSRLQNLFLFPSGDGAWINYIPELHSIPPPF